MVKTHKHKEIKSLAPGSHREAERKGLEISSSLGSIQTLQKTVRAEGRRRHHMDRETALPQRGVQPLITALKWILIRTSRATIKAEQAYWRIA